MDSDEPKSLFLVEKARVKPLLERNGWGEPSLAWARPSTEPKCQREMSHGQTQLGMGLANR